MHSELKTNQRTNQPLVAGGRMWFEAVCSIMISVNAVLLTFQADQLAQKYAGHEYEFYRILSAPMPFHDELFAVVETLFCAFFAIEWLLRCALLYKRAKLFRSSFPFIPRMFAFDFVVIFAAILSLLNGFFVNITAVRAVRLVKSLRTLKLCKPIRSIRRMHLLLNLGNGFVNSLLFALLLVSFVSFFFAGAFVQKVAQVLRDDAHLEPADRDALAIHWGSMWRASISLYKAALGGVDWIDVADPLEKVSLGLYLAFLLYITIFSFLVVNFVMSMFFQSTLESMQGPEAKALKVRMLQESHTQLVHMLQGVCNKDDDEIVVIDPTLIDQFINSTNPQEEYPQLFRFCSETGCDRQSMSSVFDLLSCNSNRPVKVEEFVFTCSQKQQTATRLDILELLQLQRESVAHLTTTLPSKQPLEPEEYSEMSMDVTNQRVSEHCETMFQRTDLAEEDRREKATFLETVRKTLELVQNAKGGVGLIVTTSLGYKALRHQNVDFQPVDKSERFKDGYMNEVVRGINISDEIFAEGLGAFTDHDLQENDRWPKGHEAEGLPKDGYVLLKETGDCKLAAVRLVGLPLSPYLWERVGTRHLAGLSACWALRRHIAVVMVRSESGKVHLLIPTSHRSVSLMCCQGDTCKRCGNERDRDELELINWPESVLSAAEQTAGSQRDDSESLGTL